MFGLTDLHVVSSDQSQYYTDLYVPRVVQEILDI